MKWSTILPLAITTIALAPSVGAWEVTWHDSDNKKHSQSGHGPSDCIEIDNPKGRVFKVDAQGEKGINMLLFTNDDCDGDASGRATVEFTKASSQDLLGFKVVSISSSSSETATANNSTSSSATESPTGSSHHASSTGDSVSGGSSTSHSSAETTETSASTSSASKSVSATPTTSTPASATTSNSAAKLNMSKEMIAKSFLGSIFGLTVAHIIHS
ncbi:hypothetical protein N7532_008717 [Penicillium argentinense]|uniref:Uncharacterized protein n=1 Tax=Penicillium argentinense TaxID=1131581 RepID=A0A9W9EXX0_9EURO|nr:uncharacterized protein N7532_008717 [Penicillium argentinense]KAJ5090033.1 hypothetical protein N7532_008717 [Penicillium argentinense]